MNGFTRLWGRRTVPRCLVPGLGVIKAGDSGLECDNPVRKVVGSVDSGLVSLYMKSHPPTPRPGEVCFQGRGWRVGGDAESSRRPKKMTDELSGCPGEAMSSIFL